MKSFQTFDYSKKLADSISCECGLESRSFQSVETQHINGDLHGYYCTACGKLLGYLVNSDTPQIILK